VPRKAKYYDFQVQVNVQVRCCRRQGQPEVPPDCEPVLSLEIRVSSDIPCFWFCKIGFTHNPPHHVILLEKLLARPARLANQKLNYFACTDV
jgi:hypothetical protein